MQTQTKAISRLDGNPLKERIARRACVRQSTDREAAIEAEMCEPFAALGS
jgi:hypothetical protein